MTIIWSFNTFAIVVIAVNFYSSASEAEVIHSALLRSNTISNSSRSNSNKSGANGGFYFPDTHNPDALLSDAEGSADGPDSDLDENASGKGEDDEDSATKDLIDKHEGSGSQPTGSGPDSDDEDDDVDTDLELGSGDDLITPIYASSTERPTKRPDVSRTSVTTPQESKELEPLEPKKDDSVVTEMTDNQLPDRHDRHPSPPELSTRFPSTRYPYQPYDDHNEETNDVSSTYMGPRSQVTPASFFARPGILAAVIGGAVVGLLCAILLVMFIVYRMRKKDEGSYALDEHKRSTAANPYTRGASKELYA